MLIETTAGELGLALAKLKHAIHKRNTIPVLGAVLLEDGAVTGTDLDIEVRITFAAKRFEGAAAIPFFQLLHLVAALPLDRNIRLQTSEGKNYGVFVTFTGGRYFLPSYPAEDFPRWQLAEDLKEMHAPAGLLAALDACTPFISTEETRYYLNGICFGRDRNGSGVLVATDGHRLHAHQYAHDLASGAILPRTTLATLQQLPEPARVLASKNQMQFEYARGCYLRSKLIDGTFPDWGRVVPQLADDAPALRFNPREMMSVLNRMGIAVIARSRSVDLSANASGDLVIVTCKYPDGEEGAERLESGTASNWTKMTDSIMSFSSAYLKAICRQQIQSEEIRLAADGSGSPAIIGPEGSNSVTVLMPMRGGNDITKRSLLTLARTANDEVAAEAVA